jgi:PAS domain S-box-containing protein
MKNQIKILHIEKCPESIALVNAELHNQQINFISKVADSAASFTNLLSGFNPDIILSEYSLPGFTAKKALGVLKKSNQKKPFIIVTGSSNLEKAEQLFSDGADDYVAKDRLNRLAQAVTNYAAKYSLEKKYSLLKEQVAVKQNNATETIQQLNKKYELITKITSDVIWDWDLVSGNVYRSKDNYDKVLDLTALQTPYCTEGEWEERIHPEDRQKAKLLKQSILQSPKKNTFELTYRVKTSRGIYVYIKDSGYVLRDKNGNALHMIGASKNITEQKLKEEELKQLSDIAREATTAIVITDENGKVLWINDAFTKITEYCLADVLGKKTEELLHGPETSPVTKRFMNIKYANKVPFKCDVLKYAKSGEKRWIRLECHPQFNKEGKHTGFFAYQTDITKEKQIEEQLVFSKERYQHLFNNSPACIFLWDIETLNILEANITSCEVYGYSAEEFKNLNIYDLRPKDEYEKINALIKKLRETPDITAEGVWKHITKDGRPLYMHITSHRIEFKNKLAMMAIATNLTEKILLQKKLVKEKKQKQKEITSAVISAQEKERKMLGSELHDNINQILASALLYLGVSKKMHPDSKALDEADKLIYNAITEIRNLSHTLISPHINDKSLAESLEGLFTITTTAGKINIHKQFDCLNEITIPDKLKLNIYRITQEQFTNILKYAKAANIYFNMACTETEIFLSIKDDGRGFDVAQKTDGVGLVNIRTRASLFNGLVDIISSPGNGCELKVSFERKF